MKKKVEKEKVTKKVTQTKKTTSKKNTSTTKKKNTKKTPIIDKLQRFISNNIYDICLAIFSIIALIVGSIAIGFKKAFIIVAFLDVIVWFLPVVSFIGNKSRRKIKRRTLAQVFLWLVIIGLIGCISFAVFIVLKAPEFNPDNLYQKEATIVYDKDGQIIAKLGDQMREKVSYEELPEILVDAIIATEDSHFFEHNGFNPARFLKASITQVLGQGGGGASTITMQVSKNAFTSFEASGIDGIIRKFTDIYMSIFKIEKNYTKEEILEFYVNSYYMGSGAWGVEQACQNYFGKSVSEINLSEAALIAGLFKGGGYYDPYIYPDNAEARRKVVLGLMQRHGYITEEEKNIALELTVDDIIVTDRKTESYQAFIDTVVEEVKKKTGQNPYSVPMEIYTTMDSKKQEHINKIMSGETFKWENDVVQAGIIVTDTNNGSIVAVGAGRNRKGVSTYNYATMINRQIGSTAKPLYDYGPAIEYNNMSTGQPIVDEPHGYSSGGNIKNWDDIYRGLMTFRTALKESRNIPALKTFQNVKNSDIKKFVTNLGLNPQIENGMIFESHSLGGYNGESPLSMAAAYAAFANGGTYIEPYSFTKIVYRETGEEYKNSYESKTVMSEATAYMVTNMLIDTAIYTTGYSSVNGIRYANKTGTTNLDDNIKSKYNLPYDAINDLWCVGYSRDFAVAVWYGYDQLNSKYFSRSLNQNVNLFRAAIKGVLTGTKDFTKPSSVTAVDVEVNSADVKLASEYTPSKYKKTEYFKVGTEPTEVSTRFSKLNNVTNLNINEHNSVINISWTPIDTPTELDSEKLKNEFSKLFEKDDYLDSFVTKRLQENAEVLGEIQYEIYLKDSTGEYQYIGSTTTNSFEYKPAILSNGIFSFKIKTSYSIFKDNASDGADVDINVNNVTSLITSNINGQENVSLNIGEIYNEPIKPVIVQENLLDITNSASITKTILDKDNLEVQTIDTTKEGTFVIIYEVKYKNHRNTLKKTITIK